MYYSIGLRGGLHGRTASRREPDQVYLELGRNESTEGMKE